MAGQGTASAKASEHRKGLERLVVALGGRVSPGSLCYLVLESVCLNTKAQVVDNRWIGENGDGLKVGK
jgi:hypothetical protein